MVTWWGKQSDPVSAQRRTDPVHPPKPPGKKDKARWCRGKVGVEHVWAVIVPPNTFGHPAMRECRAIEYYRMDGSTWNTWLCKHRVVCQKCGRIKRRATQSECESGVLDSAESTL